ncbi:MAG: NUDIX domain-containing protein [Patescibacteria group bacterium]|jgi:hypothetical protein
MQGIVKINRQDVEISYSVAVNFTEATMAINSRIFKNWKNSLSRKFKISHIFIQAVDFRGEATAKNVLFIRMKVTCANLLYPAVVELRGNTVVMLPIIDVDGEIFTVLVRQPRIATGKIALPELPAGMIDNGTFSGAAARELYEELGLVVGQKELIDMTENLPASANGIYFSPGMLDEKAKFYMIKLVMTRKKMQELQNKITGVANEGEKITLQILQLRLLSSVIQDGKSFIALALYHQLGYK